MMNRGIVCGAACVQASEDDCGDFEISEDVIRQYRANEHVHARERLALRQTLRQKFESMQQRSLHDTGTDVPSACKDSTAAVHAWDLAGMHAVVGHPVCLSRHTLQLGRLSFGEQMLWFSCEILTPQKFSLDGTDAILCIRNTMHTMPSVVFLKMRGFGWSRYIPAIYCVSWFLGILQILIACLRLNKSSLGSIHRWSLLIINRMYT